MKLATHIKFKTETPTASVFESVQKIIKTPKNTKATKKLEENFFCNPIAVDMECWMAAYSHDEYTVIALYIPSVWAHKMYGIVHSIIQGLHLSNYEIHESLTDKWHQNDFSFLTEF